MTLQVKAPSLSNEHFGDLHRVPAASSERHKSEAGSTEPLS